jgi:hypothetical protein
MTALATRFYRVNVRISDHLPDKRRKIILGDTDVLPPEIAAKHRLKGISLHEMLGWIYIGHTVQTMEIRNLSRVSSRMGTKNTTMNLLIRALVDKHQLRYLEDWSFDSYIIDTRMAEKNSRLVAYYEDALRCRALADFFSGEGPRVHVQGFDIRHPLLDISAMYTDLAKHPERQEYWRNLCRDMDTKYCEKSLTVLPDAVPYGQSSEAPGVVSVPYTGAVGIKWRTPSGRTYCPPLAPRPLRLRSPPPPRSCYLCDRSHAHSLVSSWRRGV